MRIKLRFVFIAAAYLIICTALNARPEYAAAQKVSCSACHARPFGGGQRNSFGKLYGLHGEPASLPDLNPIVSADVRSVAYYPTQKTSERRNGIGLMSTIIGANVPWQRSNAMQLHSVVSYDAGLFMPGVRDAYLALELNKKGLPDQIMIGRFPAPFGLLTDEHRTYTRLLTKTTNRDYSMGMNVSQQFFSSLHYDFAITSGFQSGGMLASADLTYALTTNLSWNPSLWPVYLGGSAAYHRSKNLNAQSPFAFSTYAIVSLAQLTRAIVKGSISSEVVWAKHWNNPDINGYFSQYFISDQFPNYQAAVKKSEALAAYVQLKLELTKQLELVYKFDNYIPDRFYRADSFMRHGGGLNTYLLGNINVMFRYEVAKVTRGSITDVVLAKQGIYYMLAHIWF